MPDIELWLKGIGLEKYAEVFARHDIDLDVAPSLSEQDLEKLGLSLGHRRKFLAAVAKLRAGGTQTTDRPSQADALRPEGAGVERRQVTVVFSDLVGSTALGSQLDPEDMDRLLQEYRKVCAAIVSRYDGHVAQYLGDGIVAFFGFPAAQEHAAERAVRAGLEIAAAVGRLKRPDGEALQSRVGIATGLVAAGTAGVPGEQTVVGDAPNLAARLQSFAEPGCVLVGPVTHRLTEGFFDYLFVGEHEVKGYREPIPMWKVLGESSIESRFISARTAGADPILGRERETAFLADAWQRAANGNGHVVVLSGEAGIGKSRLLEALVEHLRDTPYRLLRAQCSPYHGNTVLYPILQLLRHQLDVRRDLSDAENLQRVERMLECVGRSTRQARVLMAELLELRTEDTLSQAEMTAAQRINASLEILEAFLMAPLDGATVLLLLEDAHWSDPTTQTLIGRLLDRIDSDRALIVVTHRPEIKPVWVDHLNATPLRCKPLGREHCAALARHLASRWKLDDALIREIVSRSDGVPLYVHELTKAVLSQQSPSVGAVPLTLRDSLMERLDRLGGAKVVAQTASVIGRQFPYDLLATVAEAGDNELRKGLEQLRESGVIIATGAEAQRTTYSFNHALIQDAAYESLSRDWRQTLHEKIAHALESGAAANGASEPAVIAHHYSRAGKFEKAARFWLLVADRSVERLAFVESVNALNFALRDAERIADPALRASLRLEAQLKLGRSLVFQKGPQSNEAELAFTEAHRLAEEANAGPQLFQSVWALYVNAARNRRYDKAKLRGEELLAISEELGDDDLKFEALHHHWGYAYFTGQTANMLAHAAEGVRRYDPARHHRFAYTFAGHDAGVCAHCIRAMGLSVAGDPAKIKPELDAALALSDRLQHPMSALFVQGIMCCTLYVTHNFDSCQTSANEMLRLATKYDLPFYGAIGSFWLGATQAARGEVTDGLRRMEPAFDPLDGIGLFVLLPAVVMVDTLARAGRDRDALALIARILDKMSDPKLGMFVSELWRIRGELIARERGGDITLAEYSLQEALRIARGQETPLLQSRAGIALATHFAERGRREEARMALAECGVSALADRTAPEIVAANRLFAELR
jgi:class 3 adenylate cyclase/ABC-type transport system involved in cytochrome c biogenesis ATPase subunit